MRCGLPGRFPRGKRPPIPHLTVNLFPKGYGLFQRKGILGPPPLPQRAFFRKIMRCGLLGRFPRGKRPPVPHLTVNLFPKGDVLFQRKGIPGPPPLPQRAFFWKIIRCGFPGRFPRGKRPPVPRASCPQDRFSPTAKAFPHPLPLDNGKRLCIYWKRHGTPYRKRSGSAPLARFPPAAAMAVWNTSGQGEPEKEQ